MINPALFLAILQSSSTILCTKRINWYDFQNDTLSPHRALLSLQSARWSHSSLSFCGCWLTISASILMQPTSKHNNYTSVFYTTFIGYLANLALFHAFWTQISWIVFNGVTSVLAATTRRQTCSHHCRSSSWLYIYNSCPAMLTQDHTNIWWMSSSDFSLKRLHIPIAFLP